AKCEANTFDGERCLYGALNSEIRNLLRDYKVVSSTIIRRELYPEFLRRLFEFSEFADVCFIVHDRKFFAHKCVLSARSDYFNDMFLDKWLGRREIYIRHELVSPYAFHGLLQFLYQGRVEIHVDYIDDLQRLAKQCKITTLMQRLEEMAYKAQFFECTKPGTKVTNLVIETFDHLELSSDFGILTEEALPLYMSNWIGPSELPFYPEERAPFADVIFCVDGHRFKCHKASFFS
uniref:BTB domain-containing protein n=1 Tax=Romanomermis culicivorax TaxID=13658 RepID=A0A915JY43_ROMCU